jgi:hypothetical protein
MVQATRCELFIGFICFVVFCWQKSFCGNSSNCILEYFIYFITFRRIECNKVLLKTIIKWWLRLRPQTDIAFKTETSMMWNKYYKYNSKLEHFSFFKCKVPTIMYSLPPEDQNVVQSDFSD